MAKQDKARKRILERIKGQASVLKSSKSFKSDQRYIQEVEAKRRVADKIKNEKIVARLRDTYEDIVSKQEKKGISQRGKGLGFFARSSDNWEAMKRTDTKLIEDMYRVNKELKDLVSLGEDTRFAFNNKRTRFLLRKSENNLKQAVMPLVAKNAKEYKSMISKTNKNLASVMSKVDKGSQLASLFNKVDGVKSSTMMATEDLSGLNQDQLMAKGLIRVPGFTKKDGTKVKAHIRKLA